MAQDHCLRHALVVRDGREEEPHARLGIARPEDELQKVLRVQDGRMREPFRRRLAVRVGPVLECLLRVYLGGHVGEWVVVGRAGGSRGSCTCGCTADASWSYAQAVKSSELRHVTLESSVLVGVHTLPLVAAAVAIPVVVVVVVVVRATRATVVLIIRHAVLRHAVFREDLGDVPPR